MAMKRKKVPKAAADMAGKNNPTSYKAMPPKGKSSAANKGGGRKLRK